MSRAGNPERRGWENTSVSFTVVNGWEGRCGWVGGWLDGWMDVLAVSSNTTNSSGTWNERRRALGSGVDIGYW